MNIGNEKLRKLTEIAKLYYEQDKTQSEIAKQYQVSRPLVSRMLKEAKAAGIVHIEIRSPDGEQILNERAKGKFGIRNGIFIAAEESDRLTNHVLAEETIKYLRGLKGEYFGIGWGTIIGVTTTLMEEQPIEKCAFRTICPLVGNSGVSNRNYHTNENVRILAQHTGAYPSYLYTPAFAETQQELDLIRQLEYYKSVYHQWEKLNVALVNIGNYPSVPDFASGARYGRLLVERKAAGRLLAYYYDGQGEIIRSDTDYAIQIPTELLGRCAHVIGICSANVQPRALYGALKTGLIDTVIATQELMKAALEWQEK